MLDTSLPFEPTPFALIAYQQKWLADTSPVKVIHKSRRIGISWAEASDCVLLASQAAGMDCWYIGYTKDMAAEFIRDCADWARHFSMAVPEIVEHEEVFEEGDEKKAILAFTIRFASGFRITALSSSPRNLRGKQGRIIIDEAAFHPNLAELLKAALAMLIWGGQVHIISTHDGEENPFNQLILEIMAGKKPYGLHRVTLDDALAAGLYRRICLVTKKEWTAEGEAQWRQELMDRYGDGAEEELLCIPSRGGGQWLTRTLIEARMTEPGEVIRYKAPAGMELWSDVHIQAEVQAFCQQRIKPAFASLNPLQRSCVGVDFGRVSDLSVFAPCQIAPNLTRRFPFLIELANTPFKAQAAFLFYLVDALPRFSHGMLDAGGNGAYLAEVAKQKYGPMQITEVKISEQWYRDATAPMKAAFEDGSIALPRNDAVLDDLAAFRLIKGVPRLPDIRSKDKTGQSRHGDAGIALLMAFAASRMDYVPLEHLSSGEPRESSQIDDFYGALNGY